ncbi:MAG: hypothetical protein ACI4FO_07225 [Acutalibacteraceae bacterium]
MGIRQNPNSGVQFEIISHYCGFVKQKLESGVLRVESEDKVIAASGSLN